MNFNTKRKRSPTL